MKPRRLFAITSHPQHESFLIDHECGHPGLDHPFRRAVFVTASASQINLQQLSTGQSDQSIRLEAPAIRELASILQHWLDRYDELEESA